MYIHNKGKYFAFELVLVTFKTHHVQSIFFFIGLKLAQFVDVKIYIVIYLDACNFGDFII